MLLVLATLGTKAGEYVAYQPTAPVAISWDTSTYPGEQFDSYQKASFVSLSKDDVIKIHITNVGSGFGYELVYKSGSDWTWTTLKTGDSQSDGVISYTVQSDDIATLIRDRGLVVKGIYFKMLDITVSSSNVESDGSVKKTLKESYDCGNWRSTDILSSGFTGLSGDYITCTVTLNTAAEDGQALFQIKGGSGDNNQGWTTLTDGQVWMNANDGAKQATIPITDNELTAIKTYGLALNGDSVTVSDVVYHYTPTKAGYRPVYIPASGYATFYGASTCALPAGVGAYYVSATTETSATLTTLSNIPASQGVILKGAEGIYQLYTTNETAASVTNNKLKGDITQTTMSGEGNYILYNNNGTPEFHKAKANSKLDAYKAYLPANNSGSAPSLSISFDGMGNTTGISNVQKTVVEDNRIYNLNGQEVKNAGKGIFIKNGKKYIIK